MVVVVGDTVRVELLAPPIGLVPTTAPVPHWYVAPVPNVAPTAVKVVEPPLQISAPVTLVGAADGWFTVIVTVMPPTLAVQGLAVFSTRIQ